MSVKLLWKLRMGMVSRIGFLIFHCLAMSDYFVPAPTEARGFVFPIASILRMDLCMPFKLLNTSVWEHNSGSHTRGGTLLSNTICTHFCSLSHCFQRGYAGVGNIVLTTLACAYTNHMLFAPWKVFTGDVLSFPL